jgi:tetratricopeptide (TPR) repeat protein/tRNA A-37 threonylcarbamoyl transferase component Bud32
LNRLDADLRIEREIARGATSIVYSARAPHPSGARQEELCFAVKALRPELADSAAAREIMQTEASALSEIQHPGVVRAFDLVAVPSGAPFDGPHLILELLPGSDLATTLAQQGASSSEELLASAKQMAHGLAAIHEAGWVHGDIKPENLRRDESRAAVWVDLGFAHRVDDTEAEVARAGTLAYRSPEEIAGSVGTCASDVFSLGIVLYELATAQHPFLPISSHRHAASAEFSSAHTPTADSARAARGTDAERLSSDLIQRLHSGRVSAPSVRRPRLPAWIDVAVLQMLAILPEDRPSAAEVAEIFSMGTRSTWWAKVQTDVRSGGTALPTREAHGRPRFAGRQRELTGLMRSIESGAHAGGAVFIESAPGMGKSRIAKEACMRARVLCKSEPIVLSSRCFELIDGQPGQPIRDLLLHWLGHERGRELGDSQRAQLEALLAPRLVEVLLQSWNAPVNETAPVALTEALASWLVALGQSSHVIITIDELEWAGTFTLNVLSRLAEDLPSTQVVLLLMRGGAIETVQDESLLALKQILPGPGGAKQAKVLELNPFSEREVQQFVEGIFDQRVPRLRLAHVLFERSGGSPMLLTEILGDLRRNAQVRDPIVGRASLLIPPDEIPQPLSLKKRTYRRIRVMNARDRDWLGRLAVLGGSLQADFIHHVFPEEPVSAIEARLSSLVQDNWLRPNGKRYRFKRADTRRAVYETIPLARRRKHHLAAANALRQFTGDELEMSRAFPLAFHLRAAGEARQLVEMLPLVVRRALLRGHPQRVHRMCRWGLEALDQLNAGDTDLSTRFALLEAAADAADRLGARRMQRRWLDHLSEYPLDPEKDPEACGRVYLLHGRYSMNTGRYGAARGQLHNAHLLFAKAGAREPNAESLRRLARIQLDIGLLEDARDYARQAREHATHGVSTAQVDMVFALVDLLDDRYEDALANIERGREQLRGERTIENSAVHSSLMLLRSRIWRALGRPRRAIAAARRAVSFARNGGERRLEVLAGARLGGLLLGAAQLDEAQALLRDAILMAEECEDQRALTLSTLWLATMLCEDNDPAGPEMLERARSTAAEFGLGRAEALATALSARAAWNGRARSEARALSRSAVELLQRYGSELPDRIVILGTHALILAEDGERAESDKITRKLETRIREINEAIRSPISRTRHRLAARSLLRGVRTTEGPIYPRVDYPWMRAERSD